jgi:hypothetical protein
MTLKEYYELLKKHDWFYQMSDDHYYFKLGMSERSKLRALAEQSDKHYSLYKKFAVYAEKALTGNKSAKMPDCPKE